MKSNVTTILAHLDLPKYDAVRDMIRAAFLARVESDFREWSEKVLTFVVPPKVSYVRDFPKPGGSGLYFTKVLALEACGVLGIHVLPHGSSAYYEAKQAAVRSGELTVDKQKVQDAADREWEGTKAFYAARVGEKIDVLLEGEAEIKCDVELNCFLVGCVVATCGKKVLTLGTSLKTNYRYGVFAANRQMTVYRQVPTVVVGYEGFDLPAREAQIERETTQAKESRKAAMLELQTEIGSLERQKRVWDDLYFSLNWSAKREKDGRAGDTITEKDLQRLNETLTKISPTLKLNSYPKLDEAKSRVKVLREALKAAKLKLREVRQPNSTEAVS